MKMLRTCRGCGCDDNHACQTEDGPCSWAVQDFKIYRSSSSMRIVPLASGVCSYCADDLQWDMGALVIVGRKVPATTGAPR